METILEDPIRLFECWVLFWVAVTPLLTTVIIKLLEDK